ncbi:MAG: DUF3160 domain-containing protein, partial [Synergistaceae bacterium]|nr:DUF3160 domain-containing protein [Synergistaceae bacterium]
MLYLEFETLSESGNEGWGGRYAWGNKKDFIALDAYQPDNSKLNPAAIPRKIRTGARLPGGIEDLESEGVKDVPREILSRISKHGFAIDPTPIIRESVDVDDMADSYRETGNYEVDFITADIFVHSFHLLFDHTLQKLERVHLAPALEKSLTRALAELERLRAGEGSGLPEGSYETARDMFSTALALLAEKPDSIGLSPIAAGEVRRVKAAEDTEESEITGKPIDYTMFKPRGHYTLTPEFERFFRAVGYLGSAELSLFDDTGRPIAANVTAAALISLVLDALGHDWEAFEEPIGYLVGVPNSGDPKIFRALARKHIGSREGEEIGKNLSDAAKITALADDIAAAIKGPAIQSTGYENRFPVFRISGRRFTWDAYVMNRLTSPRVGTDASPRNIPEGTDVMAALGSSVADKYAGKNDAIKNYRENLEMLKLETRDYLSGENTVYAKWLSVFKAGFEDSGSKQFFYNKPAWQWKKLSTYLASWAELKHDTILYGEASAAEMGEGGDLYAGRFAAPKPRGYVEPDPQVFDALLAAVRELRGLIGK